MDIKDELALSYYNEITTLDSQHNISLVQHVENKQIYVKKTLNVYNLDVYSYLKDNPILGIPRIYELIEDTSSIIVIEDFISGQSLEKILSQGGSLPEDTVVNYVIQLCKIVSQLHTSFPPIIHRDIKPTNIIITPNNDVMLIDLNAAKYASEKNEDTTLLGTRGYAAPEQYGFGSSSTQTDIYAIGMLINTMLNGSFTQDVIKGNLYPIIKRCTELTPQNRYNSVDELSNALRPFLNNSDQSNRHSFKEFLPPGYRSGNYVNMIIATAYYAFSAWMCSGLQFQQPTTHASLILERFGCFSMMLVIPLCTFNYLDVQDRFPLCKSENRLKRILGVVVLDIIAFISTMVITIIVSMIFS